MLRMLVFSLTSFLMATFLLFLPVDGGGEQSDASAAADLFADAATASPDQVAVLMLVAEEVGRRGLDVTDVSAVT